MVEGKQFVLLPVGEDKAKEISKLFKIIVLGPEDVGKTTIIMRFKGDGFSGNYIPTIGVDFAVKTVETSDGDVIKLQIWDTAGQERFRTITNSYYRGAHGLILVYDVTKRNTFDQLPDWLKDIEEKANANRVVALVGNKDDADADPSMRQVTTDEGERFANENGILFAETSAKDGNVNQIFQMLVEQLMKIEKQMSTAPEPLAMTMPGPVKGGKGKGQPADKRKENKNSVVLTEDDTAKNAKKTKTCVI